jgi:hypothetical protein
MGTSTTTSADQASEKATGKMRGGGGNVISNSGSNVLLLPQQRSGQRSISVQFLLVTHKPAEKLSSALGHVVLLASVPALGAGGATAAAWPLARVRRRAPEYLRAPPAVRIRGGQKSRDFFPF